MKHISILIVLCSIFSFNSICQTHITDSVISGTWTKSNSPYIINRDVTILDDNSLLIEPGVTVKFNGYFKILVLGNLVAIGQENNQIHFNAVDSIVGWNGIYFDNFGIKELGGVENAMNNNDSTIFKYCNFKFGNGPDFDYDGFQQRNYGAVLKIFNFNKIRVTKCDFSNNRGFIGGCVFLFRSNIDINSCRFFDNELIASGGGIYIEDSAPRITSSIFRNNKAGSGGGIAIYNGSPLITNNYFENNNVNSEGGAIYCIGGSKAVILNNKFYYNSAKYSGGGLYFNQIQDNIIVKGNVISKNISQTQGGGVYFHNPTHYTKTYILFENNYIEKNSSKLAGGGLYLSNGKIDLINNIIANNESNKGGGIYIEESDNYPYKIINTVITNNKAFEKGGGIHLITRNYISFINSIIWGNRSIDNTQLSVQFENENYLEYINCCIEDGENVHDWNPKNNFTINPSFKNPTLSTGVNSNTNDANPSDWSLNDCSYLINAGFSNFDDIPETDIIGNPRVVKGEIDIGAFEYAGNYSTYYLRIDTTICNNDLNTIWKQQGIYIDTFKTMFGCDSIVKFYVTIQDADTITENVSICHGSNYFGWNTSGNYLRHYTNLFGCDSVIITELIVKEPIEVIENISICLGESYQGWDHSGVYQRILMTESGCDSIVITNLKVNTIPDSPIIKVNADTISVSENLVQYQWYSSSGAIKGANRNIHICTRNDQYWVKITNESGCSSFSNSVYVNVTSNLDIILGNKIVYPNPVKDVLYIPFSKFELYSTNGELIKSGKCEYIDFKELNSAFYVLILLDYNKTFKIFKE